MGKEPAEQHGGAATAADRLRQQERRQATDLLQVAFRKIQAGEKLTSKERSAVTAWEREQLSKWGTKYVAACPKKDYCEAVGIQQKVAIEQSRRFNLPYHTAGKTVNLFEQLAAFHAWVSDNKHAINRVIRAQRHEREEGLDDDAYDYWDTRRVKATALLKEHEYEERLGRMQPIEVVHELLQEFYVSAMVKRIEQLEKRDNPLAHELADCLRQDIKQFELAIEALFEDDDSPTQETNPAT